jgi:hypothetical protein
MPVHITRAMLQVLYLEQFGSPRAPNTLRELLGVLNVRGGDDETPRERKTLNLMGAAYLADDPAGRAVKVYTGADIEITPSVTGTIHNYRPTDWDDASIVAFTTTGITTITGFDSFSCRKLEKLLVNNGSHAITISHESSSSQHDNRVLGSGNAAVALAVGEAAWLVRDAVSARWRCQEI